MKEIILTSGQVTQVSDVDFEFLSQWKWHAIGTRGGPYVGRLDAERNNVNLHSVVLDRCNLHCKLGEEPDHKDRDHFNNQRDNLRIVSKSVNRHNTNMQHNNTSGVRGVTYNRRLNKWIARISVNRKSIQLGSFISLHEAAQARKDAEFRYGVSNG